ncbi:MAG: hypothetical protein ACREIC_32860, partial [Limisphaerales bacterium]
MARHRGIEALKLIHLLRGDLDWIVMKCLEKDRARRYETANDLAKDVQRHLESEPVLARPPSALYRWQKVVKRNKLGFAAATAVALALVLGAAASTWQALRVERERQQLQRNVIRQYVANGTRLMNEGDLFASLLWYTEALRLDAGDARREEPHRIRIASVLRQCPKLLNVFSHGKMLYHAQFSPDGSKLLTTSDDSTARLWDVTSGLQLLVLRHNAQVYDGAFSRDGLRVITSGQDKTARIWDSRTGALLQSLQHPATVWRARFSPDGSEVATTCDDQSVRLWSGSTGAPVAEPLRHGAIVLEVAFSPDGRLLLTKAADDTAELLEVATGRSLFHCSDTSSGCDDLEVRFSPDSRRFLTCDDSKLHVWDSLKVKELEFSPLEQPGLVEAAFSPDGGAIVAAGYDATARVWDANTGRPRFSPAVQHSGIITSARIAPDGRSFITGGNDAVAKLWSTGTGQLLAPPLKTILHARYVSFAPDGRRLLVQSCDEAARVWDMATSDLPGPLRPETVSEHRVISPDGRYALLQGVTNTLWIVDTHTNRLAALPHTNRLVYASFSGDGRTVLTASAQQNWVSSMPNEIFLWEVPSGRRLNRGGMEQG